MRSATANYTTENNKTEKTPVALVSATGITRRYSSDTFSNISGNDKKLIRSMRTDLLNIDLLRGKTAFGSSRFEILDESLDVSTTLQANDLEGRDVTIKMGYDNLSDTDFVSLPDVKLQDVQLNGDLLSYKFVTKDVVSKLDKQVFTGGPTAIVQTAYTSGDLEVDSTSDFYAPSSFPAWMNVYVAVGGEIMSYTSTPSGPVRFSGIGRAELGTKSGAHNAGDEVKQVVGFELVNPMHALLTILLSGDPNDTTVKHDFYDVLTTLGSGNALRFGAGLTSADVNIKQIEELGWKHFEALEYSLYLSGGNGQEENLIDFISKNILAPTGTYLYMQNGKLCVGIYDWLEINENYSADDTLSNDDIVVDSEPKMTLDYKNLINLVEIRFGRNTAVGGHQNIKRYKFDDSETQYGLIDEPFVITTPNLDRSANTDWIKSNFARRWLYFWGNVHAKWVLPIFSKKWLVEAGDQVDVTFNKFPDLTSAPVTRGWTSKKSFVTGQQVEWFPDTSFVLEGRTWEIFNRVTALYTVTKNFTSGSGNLSFNTTNSAVFQLGSDRKIDISAASTGQVFIAFVDLTGPGTATTTSEYVQLGIHIQSVADTDIKSDNRPYIRFVPSDTAVRNLAFIVTTNTSQSTLDNVKLDFYGRSGAAADDPTLNFKEVWVFDLDKSLTEV